jgi:hypothetical protein
MPWIIGGALFRADRFHQCVNDERAGGLIPDKLVAVFLPAGKSLLGAGRGAMRRRLSRNWERSPAGDSAASKIESAEQGSATTGVRRPVRRRRGISGALRGPVRGRPASASLDAYHRRANPACAAPQLATRGGGAMRTPAAAGAPTTIGRAACSGPRSPGTLHEQT